MKYKILLIVCTLLSFYTVADNEFYEVKRVGAHSDKGWVYIEVNRFPIGSTCEGKIKEFVWRASDPVANNIMSIALTAQTTNKKIRIRHDPGACIEGYPTGAWVAILSK